MKLVLFVLTVLVMAGCSSAPQKKLYKNCEEAGKGSSLFYCEELPSKEVGKK
jgi:uncharacterized lipoprotein